MRRDDLVRVRHMLDAAKEVLSFAKNKSREDLDSDRMLVLSIVKSIEIIGEAVNRIFKRDKDFKLNNARQIIGTRNRIAHGYDKITDDLIWSIIINSLPKLKEEVEDLLKQ